MQYNGAISLAKHATNIGDTKECVEPESNKTLIGTSEIESVPSTTPLV